METLVQVLVIAGVCAGLGAMLSKRNHQTGAALGLVVGLLLAGGVYWYQCNAAENAEFQKRVDKAARDSREMNANWIRNQQESQKYGKQIDDIFNGKMPKDDDR